MLKRGVQPTGGRGKGSHYADDGVVEAQTSVGGTVIFDLGREVPGGAGAAFDWVAT